MKKRNPSATTMFARTRLFDYSNEIVEDTIELTKLATLYPELEAYRKHFLSENGDTCLHYRLSVLLLTLSRFAQDDDCQTTKLSSFIERYCIFESLVEEIVGIKIELFPN